MHAGADEDCEDPPPLQLAGQEVFVSTHCQLPLGQQTSVLLHEGFVPALQMTETLEESDERMLLILEVELEREEETEERIDADDDAGLEDTRELESDDVGLEELVGTLQAEEAPPDAEAPDDADPVDPTAAHRSCVTSSTASGSLGSVVPKES